MHLDDLFDIFYWIGMAFVCAIMAVVGWFIPWIGPTIVFGILGMAVVVATYTRTDVLQSIVMFVVCPLIGSLFHRPSLSLGDYQWLTGLWMNAFLVGYLTTYLFQRNGKRLHVPPGTPAAHH